MNKQISTEILDEVWDWPEMPTNLPSQCFQRISVCSGLVLMLIDFHPQENIAFNVEIGSSPLEIGCSLSGNVRGTVSHSRGQKENFSCGPGQTWLSFYPKSHGTIEFLAGQPIRAVGIQMAPGLLRTFMDIESDHIPAYIRGIVDGTNENHFNHVCTMTTRMHSTIHQIMNCPDHGFTRRIFLESKALELLSYLIGDDSLSEYSPSLCADDEERIRHAKDILISNMENPPSLAELARKVGLCTTRLNTGFRQVFGTSVFGYLKRHRLEKARWLIEIEDKSVSEAAWEVGYSSLSSFHRAFVNEYGINPSSCYKNPYKIRNSFLHASCKSIASI